jgi:hypothetical protein
MPSIRRKMKPWHRGDEESLSAGAHDCAPTATLLSPDHRQGTVTLETVSPGSKGETA